MSGMGEVDEWDGRGVGEVCLYRHFGVTVAT